MKRSIPTPPRWVKLFALAAALIAMAVAGILLIMHAFGIHRHG